MRARSERGAVLVTAVLFMPVMLFMLVFVVDVGNWWTHKRQAQLQVDAAALSGGDKFGECFSNNGKPSANADSTMQAEADVYAGVPGVSTYNKFGGSNKGDVSRLCNSKAYPFGGQADDTVEGSSCDSGQFDVKESEHNLPLFLASVVP